MSKLTMLLIAELILCVIGFSFLCYAAYVSGASLFHVLYVLILY